jgi:hypothetical protein
MYKIKKKQPFQFILCGVIQVILDSFVVFQIFYYWGLGGIIIKGEKEMGERMKSDGEGIPSISSEELCKRE